MIIKLRPLIGLFSLLFILIGCEEKFYFDQEIKSTGHIPYTYPVSLSGPGTLVDFNATRFGRIADANICFGKSQISDDIPLVQSEDISLPSKVLHLNLDNVIKAKILKILGGMGPNLKLENYFSRVSSVKLEFKNPKAEYMDLGALLFYYKHSLSSFCHDMLSRSAFINQAISVEGVDFEFFTEDGGRFLIETEKLKEIVDLGVETKWKVEKGHVLKINSKRYLGYQLATIEENTKGIQVYRAHSTIFGRYIWSKVFAEKSIDRGIWPLVNKK